MHPPWLGKRLIKCLKASKKGATARKLVIHQSSVTSSVIIWWVFWILLKRPGSKMILSTRLNSVQSKLTCMLWTEKYRAIFRNTESMRKTAKSMSIFPMKNPLHRQGFVACQNQNRIKAKSEFNQKDCKRSASLRPFARSCIKYCIICLSLTEQGLRLWMYASGKRKIKSSKLSAQLRSSKGLPFMYRLHEL